MNRIDRAKQFAPFSALRGFDLMVRETSKIKCDKISLEETDLIKIDETLKNIKKGDLIKVKYYNKDCYEIDEGLVSEINVINQRIVLVKKIISFSDIYSIEKI